MLEYDYDENRNVLSITGTLKNSIGKDNSILYKGYVYDRETGLYLLTTRYYNPEWGRFLNADDVSYLDPESVNGLNLYAYCYNNPIMYLDSNGTSPQWLQTLGWVGLAVGAVLVIGAITVLTAGVGTATLAGAIAVGAAKGALIGAAIGVGVGATAGAVGSLISGEEFGSTEFWSNTLFGAMAGFGAGALIGAVSGGVAGYVGYTPTKITGFTRHGMNQIISRDGHGVANKAILETMRAPNKVASQGLMRTSFKYAGKNAVVVLNKTGKVITAYAKSRAGWRVGLALWLGYEYL